MNQNRRGEARSALREVQSRHTEIQKIEKTIIELAQLFEDMNQLVEEQEEVVVDIERRGEEVEENVQKGTEELKTAVDTARATRRKKWWCLLICRKHSFAFPFSFPSPQGQVLLVEDVVFIGAPESTMRCALTSISAYYHCDCYHRGGCYTGRLTVLSRDIASYCTLRHCTHFSFVIIQFATARLTSTFSAYHHRHCHHRCRRRRRQEEGRRRNGGLNTKSPVSTSKLLSRCAERKAKSYIFNNRSAGAHKHHLFSSRFLLFVFCGWCGFFYYFLYLAWVCTWAGCRTLGCKKLEMFVCAWAVIYIVRGTAGLGGKANRGSFIIDDVCDRIITGVLRCAGSD